MMHGQRNVKLTPTMYQHCT